MKENSPSFIPSNIKTSQIDLFILFSLKLFIEKDEFHCLQDIVDIATLHHVSQNVPHDLDLFKMEELNKRNEDFKDHGLKQEMIELIYMLYFPLVEIFLDFCYFDSFFAKIEIILLH